MKDYAKMTSKQINKAILPLIGREYARDHSHKKGVVVDANGVPFNFYDPSDSWYIIAINEIGVDKLKCEPYWIANHGDYFYRDENPLRAAMIVFLMMNEGEK